MEEIRKQLFDLAEKHDKKGINDKDYIMSVLNVLQNNNANITVSQIDYLVDFILNDQIFDA